MIVLPKENYTLPPPPQIVAAILSDLLKFAKLMKFLNHNLISALVY